MPYHQHQCNNCQTLFAHNLDFNISEAIYEREHKCPSCQTVQKERFFDSKETEVIFSIRRLNEYIEIRQKLIESNNLSALFLFDIEVNIADYKQYVFEKAMDYIINSVDLSKNIEKRNIQAENIFKGILAKSDLPDPVFSSIIVKEV